MLRRVALTKWVWFNPQIIDPRPRSYTRGCHVTKLICPLSDRTDAAVVAIVAIAISLAGASRPSFWYDEAATISTSYSRSLPELARLLNKTDLVHGGYYLQMHGWFKLFPPTELWSRVPSALAIGAAAAGVVVLAKQFSTRSTAICAGMSFAVLPRTTWAGVEARPYALSMTAAVWLSVLLVTCIRRDKGSLWLLYAMLLLLGIVLDVYLAMMILVHAAWITVLRCPRSIALRFASAAAVAVVISAPFLWSAHGQIQQVDWIPALGWRILGFIGLGQYFDRSVPFAVVAALIVSAAIWLRHNDARPQSLNGDRQLLLIAVAWIAIPTLIVAAYSLAVDPIYQLRYLSFTAPAAGVVLGRCIAAIAKTKLHMSLLLTMLVLAAFPNYLFGQRGPYGKGGMDYSAVADLIASEARPGDCLLLDDTVSWRPAPIRPLVAARPGSYKELVDVGLGEPATSADTVFDGNRAHSWSPIGLTTARCCGRFPNATLPCPTTRPE